MARLTLAESRWMMDDGFKFDWERNGFDNFGKPLQRLRVRLIFFVSFGCEKEISGKPSMSVGLKITFSAPVMKIDIKT